MSIFHNISYQKKTTKTRDEIYLLLDTLLLNDKYDGRWINGILYLQKIVWLNNRIEPEFIIKIIDNQDERVISVNCVDREDSKIIISFFYIILIIFETLFIYAMISARTFTFISLGPVVMGIFLYFLYYISYQLSLSDFKWVLNKLLK